MFMATAVDSCVGVGLKSMALTETVVVVVVFVVLYARTLHHFKTPRKPPLKKLL